MQFEQLTENMEVMIATSDQSGNANYFNKAWEIFTGLSRFELRDYGWADLIHEEDKAGFLKMHADARAVRRNWKGEFRMRNFCGEYRWLLATGIKLETNGVFAGYVSSSVDITEQIAARRIIENSAETLRELVLTAPIGICVLDAPSLIAEIVNDSFVEIAGKPYAFIMGNYYWDTFAEAAPYYEKALREVVENGKPFYANEVALTLIRNGKPEDIYVTFVYTPIINLEGEVRKVIVWVLENTHQVTARQRIEEEVAKRTKELAEANENLQETNAELAQFAYISSHDLQEPLRKISVYSQMAHKLIDASTHPREANFLTKITSSTGRMQALIRDVLAYSELSTPDHLFTQVDLNVVAANVKGDFELLIEEYQATIEWVGLPVLDANEVQLSQLFGNMMGNALKFTSKNRAPILRITASSTTNDERLRHALSAGKEYITLHFADNGIGILPENRKIIFNIFQRLHRKSEYEGTGIGLALCKKIALNHHGAIDAEGSSEEGAVFNVILPVKQVPKKP